MITLRYVTPDLYTFEPVDPGGNADTVSKSLTVNRHTGDILLNGKGVQVWRGLVYSLPDMIV